MEAGFDWIGRYRYGAIFTLLMLGIVGLPISDESLLIFVGYLSFKGTLQLEPAVVTAFLGSASGITISYALGRFVGLPALLKFGYLFHLRPDHLAKAQQWVERWGRYSLLVAYFIPGLRHLGALILGAALLPPTVFARFAYTGALIWSTSFIGIGYIGGEEWNQLSPLMHRTLVVVTLLVLLTLAIGVAWCLVRRTLRSYSRASGE
ncbi:MAG TPA: DedA family protein [Nitrospiraceae bacterium]|nr:DedA family protein [Nitrospiraceae bacterium]